MRIVFCVQEAIDYKLLKPSLEIDRQPDDIPIGAAIDALRSILE